MQVKEQLDKAIANYNLLNHPFYQAWECGELPVDKLRLYAREYGAFVRTVADGWTVIGDAETAAEEREHAGMWDAFAATLGTKVGVPSLSETMQLVETASGAFEQPASALGGLYAFEAQQPATARTKLDGLRKHYDVPAAGETYFETHVDDDHEAAEILERIEALDEPGQQAAIAACDAVAAALWHGLDGVLAAN